MSRSGLGLRFRTTIGVKNKCLASLKENLKLSFLPFILSYVWPFLVSPLCFLKVDTLVNTDDLISFNPTSTHTCTHYIGDKSWCISPIPIWCPICIAAKLLGSKCPTTLVSISLVFVLGSLCSFFHFILRFWNQILICLSERTKEWAISIRLLRVRYLKQT